MHVKNKSKMPSSVKKWDKIAWLSKSQHKDTSMATFISPVWNIVISACEKGIHSLSWQTEEDVQCQLKSKSAARDGWGEVVDRHGPHCDHLEAAVAWLRQYFSDPHVRLESPPLCYGQVKSESCIPVWNKLKEKVGPGATISYGALAALCGNPKASRHMGYAMAHNPFTLIVPCHRVVTSNGALGNYCRGTKNQVKEWLYGHEMRSGTKNVMPITSSG